MTLIHEIKSYLKSRPLEWVNGGEIEDFGRKLGYKASHADRRGRDIVDPEHHGYDPAIESRLNEKRCIEYRYNPEKDPTKPKISTPQPLFNLPPKTNSERWAK